MSSNNSRLENGSITVAALPLIVILVIMAIGSFKVAWTFYIANEVQGTMDVAGVAALRRGVDEVALREEKLVIDETVVRNAYRQLVRKSKLQELIGASSFSIKTEVIKGTGSLVSVGGGLSFTGARQQYYLVSIIYATVPQVNIFDQGAMATYEYFDIFKNRKFSITYQGNDLDGTQEMVIRSVSRLVLR